MEPAIPHRNATTHPPLTWTRCPGIRGHPQAGNGSVKVTHYQKIHESSNIYGSRQCVRRLSSNLRGVCGRPGFSNDTIGVTGRGGSSGLELDEPRSAVVLLLNFLTAAAIARPGRGTTLPGPRFGRSSRSIRISGRGRSRIHEAHCERARDYKSHNAHEYLPLCGAFP